MSTFFWGLYVDGHPCSVLVMTQPVAPPGPTDRVAAAFQVYADAIRYGHAPIPNYITLHTAGCDFETFMALADHHAATITIVVPPEDDATWSAYAFFNLPFGEGILPDSVRARVHVTTAVGPDARRRKDIAAHNAECVTDEVPA